MRETLKSMLDEALAELKHAGSSDHLEKWLIRYLGTKGALKAAMSQLKDVAKEEKPRMGQFLNEIKVTLEQEYDRVKQSVSTSAKASGPLIDVTEPGLPMGLGRRHVLS